MGQIDVIEYNDPIDFKLRYSAAENHIDLSIRDFIRHAATLGNFSGHSVSEKGIRFYQALVEMAIADTGERFVIRDDYKNCEQSIKTSISFFMGMIAGKIVADNIYDIPLLYHLKDERITYGASGKIPDFFGISRTGDAPVLIESKGTTRRFPSQNTVEKGKEQLNSISAVYVNGAAGRSYYPGASLSRHVIASSFKGDTLIYHDIDPLSEGEECLNIDLNVATLLYYRNIMELFSSGHSEGDTTEEIENVPYIVAKLGTYTIGLNREIYMLLKEYSPAAPGVFENDPWAFQSLSGIYQETSNIISKTGSLSNAQISIGSDGIICR